MSRLKPLHAALVGAALLAACGSSKTLSSSSSSSSTSASTTSTTTANTTTTAAPSATTTAAAGATTTTTAAAATTTTTAAAATTTTAAGVAASGSLPAVAGATDLTKAPVPAAGVGPAPTTLQMRDLVVGKGTAAVASNTVKVQYVGTNFVDGKQFDASWTSGQPADFPLNGVIPGFSQGIVGMKIGGRRELVIPPDLGYGAQGSPPSVGPNETLVFVIDLLGIS